MYLQVLRRTVIILSRKGEGAPGLPTGRARRRNARQVAPVPPLAGTDGPCEEVQIVPLRLLLTWKPTRSTARRSSSQTPSVLLHNLIRVEN